MPGELLHVLPDLSIKWERVLFLSDIHVPYHDKKLIENVLEFMAWYKPHTVFWNGDISDCYDLSSFNKDPSRAHNLQKELDETRELLRRGREATPKGSVHYYVPGNHEARIERYLWTKAPALASLRCLKLAELLELKDLRICLAPRTGVLLRNDFLVYHGQFVRGETGATGKAEMEKFGLSGISGHVHRLGSYRKTDRTGTREWYEQGCLCETDPEFIIGQPNWCPGFAVGEFDTLSDRRSIDTVVAKDGAFAFRGKTWGSR